MTRALMPLLKRHPVAAIVNVSSVASMLGVGSSIAYMASKGALNAMTFGLARAFGPEVRVNAVAPGLVETPWLRGGLGEARYAATVAAYKGRATLAEVIAPEDVARSIWYLGVDAAKTTGEVLLLDAGLRLSKA
jgi:NAD(P)-dependent dehydrogenase (short-subunit alcohol dehydrogenase family)